MIRPASPVRLLSMCLMLACLFGVLNAPAWADGPTVTAVFGIGGRYRPGGWCPVTVKVRNPGADPLDAQVQALSEASPNTSRFGGPTSTMAGAALFSRPLSVPGGGAGQTQLYTLGLDPGAGSVTVQIADGRTRGDGRILAQGSSSSNGGSALPAVSGLPLTDQDLFLVGFGGDPGAFTGLNGQKLGLVHLPGVGAGLPSLPPGAGAQPLSLPTGNAQVVTVLPADLPDRPAGYTGVDAFLLRGDAPLDALSEAQADALKDWVAGGGHLVVVCAGADPGPYAAPFFQGLLPATVQATGKGTLTLTPKPLPGVRSTVPALVTGPYGAGWVSVTTRDLAAASPSPASSPSPAFWAAVLTAPRTLLGAASAHDSALAQSFYGYSGSDSALMSGAVLRGPSLDAPGTWVIGLFLLAYLIVLVPVNYLILKRLDRRELAWATIPALVIVFAVGTFGVGYAAKGGSIFVNRAAIIETAAGQTAAGVRGALGLFSPRRTSYDLTLNGTGLSATLPFALPNRFGSGGDAQPSGQTRLVQTPGGASLLDAAVNMWAMRAFDFQSSTDLGGTVDVSTLGNMLTVTNHTPHTLSGCQVIRGGTSYPVGSLAAGGTAQVSLFSMPHISPQMPGLPLPQMSPSFVNGSADQSVTPRMQAALSDYARSLGQPDNSNAYYYTRQGMAQPRTPFAPAPNEALLVGWSEDPALAGPLPRVDGQPVTVHSTTLVVVHLPLPASLAAQAQPPPQFSPPHDPSRPSPSFGFVARSSAVYRQALDVRSLAVTPSSLGKTFSFRGLVSAVHASSFQRPTLVFGTLSGRALTTVLAFSHDSQELSIRGLQGREVIVSGTLTRLPSGPQIVVLHSSQINLVAGGSVGVVSPLTPAPPLPPAPPLTPAPPPPPPTYLYGFRTILQTASAYQRAVDARTLAVTANNVNQRLTVRGIVMKDAYAVSARQMIVRLGPQTQMLLPLAFGEQFRSLALRNQEVLVTGTLTRQGSSPQIAVTQLSQVRPVVGGSNSRKLSPNSKG